MTNTKERERVLEIAKEWIGTPYHHNAIIKGVGVDCAMFLKAVYEAAGIEPLIDIKPYSHQWHMHKGEEVFLNTILLYTKQIQGEPLPGDIALYKYGRCVSHGGIVVCWPVIIHSVITNSGVRIGVTADNVTRLQNRFYGFFRPNKWINK